MLSNRHVVAALLVMPLLALLGWWAAGNLVGEQPQPAREGMAYPLLEQSGCRYEGGACRLDNVDVSLALAYTREGQEHYLDVLASLPVEIVFAAIGPADADSSPRPMTARDSSGTHWRLLLQERPGADQRIRLVARAGGSSWYGEAGTVFLQSRDTGR